VHSRKLFSAALNGLSHGCVAYGCATTSSVRARRCTQSSASFTFSGSRAAKLSSKITPPRPAATRGDVNTAAFSVRELPARFSHICSIPAGILLRSGARPSSRQMPTLPPYLLVRRPPAAHQQIERERLGEHMILVELRRGHHSLRQPSSPNVCRSSPRSKSSRIAALVSQPAAKPGWTCPRPTRLPTRACRRYEPSGCILAAPLAPILVTEDEVVSLHDRVFSIVTIRVSSFASLQGTGVRETGARATAGEPWSCRLAAASITEPLFARK